MPFATGLTYRDGVPITYDPPTTSAPSTRCSRASD
jgi:hypothetical protein